MLSRAVDTLHELETFLSPSFSPFQWPWQIYLDESCKAKWLSREVLLAMTVKAPE